MLIVQNLIDHQPPVLIPILMAVVGGRGKEQDDGAYNDELCVIVNPHRYTVCEEDEIEEEDARDRWGEEDRCNIVLAEREKRVEEDESEEGGDEERYQGL